MFIEPLARLCVVPGKGRGDGGGGVKARNSYEFGEGWKGAGWLGSYTPGGRGFPPPFASTLF